MRDKRKIYVLLGTVIFLALAAEILFALPHHHMIWNEVPGADIVIGFSAGKIIMKSRGLMVSLPPRNLKPAAVLPAARSCTAALKRQAAGQLTEVLRAHI